MLISPKYKAAEIQSRHHCLTLDFRGQDRLIRSDSFVEAWNRANEKERRKLLNICNTPNSMKLKAWILKIMVGGLEQFPINILRQLASFHCIKNYSRMTKTNLLIALKEKGVKDDSRNIK